MLRRSGESGAVAPSGHCSALHNASRNAAESRSNEAPRTQLIVGVSDLRSSLDSETLCEALWSAERRRKFRSVEATPLPKSLRQMRLSPSPPVDLLRSLFPLSVSCSGLSSFRRSRHRQPRTHAPADEHEQRQPHERTPKRPRRSFAKGGLVLTINALVQMDAEFLESCNVPRLLSHRLPTGSPQGESAVGRRMRQLVRQIPPLLLVADVLLPVGVGAILGVAGHHHLQRLRLPLGPQLDQRVAEVDSPVGPNRACQGPAGAAGNHTHHPFS